MELLPIELKELRGIEAALNNVSSERIKISKRITRSDFRRLKRTMDGFTNEIVISPEYAARQSRSPVAQRPCSCREDYGSNECLGFACEHQPGTRPPAYDSDGRLTEAYLKSDETGFDFIRECNSLCGCGPETCKNRVVQRGNSVPKELFSTRDKGLGVRALVDIEKGEFVGTYAGRLRDRDFVSDTKKGNSYRFAVHEEDYDDYEYVIDAYKEGNVTRFINHHCEPNLLSMSVYGRYADLGIAEIAFFAKEDIPAKKELSYDYGEGYLEGQKMECKCSSRRHIYTPKKKKG